MVTHHKKCRSALGNRRKEERGTCPRADAHEGAAQNNEQHHNAQLKMRMHEALRYDTLGRDGCDAFV